MFSLSTSWNASRHANGIDLINEIKALGLDTVELSFALTESVVSDILTMKDSSRIKVSSLHNMCPLPAEIEPEKASPDYYSLASPDDGERRRAIDIAKRTIDYANRFGAKAIILHTGRIEIKDRTRRLASIISDKAASSALRDDMIRERELKKDGYLDNLLESLAQVVPWAVKKGVLIGIENRYYYREIPLIDEIGEILKSFKELYYWHDVGHAEVFERLGFVRHRDLLERFQNRLLGLHLHDIIGPIEDHNPPGLGTFDFTALKPYVTGDAIKVIEVHHPATAEEIKMSVKHLEKVFGA